MDSVSPRFRRIASEKGAGLVEYALLLALIALAVIVILGIIGGSISDLFNAIRGFIGT